MAFTLFNKNRLSEMGFIAVFLVVTCSTRALQNNHVDISSARNQINPQLITGESLLNVRQTPSEFLGYFPEIQIPLTNARRQKRSYYMRSYPKMGYRQSYYPYNRYYSRRQYYRPNDIRRQSTHNQKRTEKREEFYPDYDYAFSFA